MLGVVASFPSPWARRKSRLSFLWAPICAPGCLEEIDEEEHTGLE
jgi:hypothetical protein